MIITINLLHEPMLYILCNAPQKKERMMSIFHCSWTRTMPIDILNAQVSTGKKKNKLPARNAHLKKKKKNGGGCETPQETNAGLLFFFFKGADLII